ncbi:TM0106 family RecB-like putative nuclease [Gordonia sinesedis]
MVTAPTDGMSVLHPRDLAGCEHRVALDFAYPEVVRARADTPEAARRKDAADGHRTRVRDLLRAVHSDQPGAFAVVDEPTHAAAVATTRRLCAAGVPWIWNATLPADLTGGRRGHSELLVRSGDGYVPIIVVNHRTSYPAKTRRDGSADRPITATTSPLWGWLPLPDPFRTVRNHRRDQLRLAHLTQMLVDLGLAPTVPDADLLAGVVGLDADCIVVHPIGAQLDDYREVFARRQAIASGEIATAPRRVGECRGCPWWSRCGPELERRHDVSLVATGNQSLALGAIGVTSIDDLAGYRGEPPPDWPSNVRFTDAVVSAIAWLDDIPLVRRVGRPRVQRADVEVDVDMESFGEDGAYLWGTLLTDRRDRDRPVIYRAFVTWQPLPTRDEARSFAQFWTWLMDERDAAHAEGKTFAAYCYSQQAENRWLLGSADRFAGEPGIPTRDEVTAFIESSEWVDIYEAVGRAFVCPRGKGLKRVAPVAGFEWRDADASGEASMDWYREAVGIGGTAVDLTQRRRLLEYNEDDVRATKVLREWMDTRARREVPLQDDLLASGADASAIVADPRAGDGSGPRGTQRVEEGPAAEQSDGAEEQE